MSEQDSESDTTADDTEESQPSETLQIIICETHQCMMKIIQHMKKMIHLMKIL